MQIFNFRRKSSSPFHSIDRPNPVDNSTLDFQSWHSQISCRCSKMKIRFTLDLQEVTRVTTSLYFMALPKAICCKRCNRRTRVRIDVTASCQPKSSNKCSARPVFRILILTQIISHWLIREKMELHLTVTGPDLLNAAGHVTPFPVRYEKIRNHMHETAINCPNRHSLGRKYQHLRINQIQ